MLKAAGIKSNKAVKRKPNRIVHVQGRRQQALCSRPDARKRGWFKKQYRSLCTPVVDGVSLHDIVLQNFAGPAAKIHAAP